MELSINHTSKGEKLTLSLTVDDMKQHAVNVDIAIPPSGIINRQKGSA